MAYEKLLDKVVEEFERHGILLLSDPQLPNVAALVAGEGVRGSWWGHPRGREIWRVLTDFEDRPDILTTRLVSGKVTFVHRRLWADFLAVATCHEDWQMKRLSTDAKSLLRLVERRGEVRTDRLRGLVAHRTKVGDTARELERRLLVYGEEAHTETGAHAKILLSWSRWLARANFVPGDVGVDSAKARIEALVAAMNDEHGGNGRLPWAAASARRTTRSVPGHT